MDGSRSENTMKKIFKSTEIFWNNFTKPGLKIASPINSAGNAARTKDTQSAQLTRKNSKSLTGGKTLSLTDMHGNGLRLKVM